MSPLCAACERRRGGKKEAKAAHFSCPPQGPGGKRRKRKERKDGTETARTIDIPIAKELSEYSLGSVSRPVHSPLQSYLGREKGRSRSVVGDARHKEGETQFSFAASAGEVDTFAFVRSSRGGQRWTSKVAPPRPHNFEGVRIRERRML